MMFSVSDQGILDGNSFTEYDSQESIIESLEFDLPQPNKKVQVKPLYTYKYNKQTKTREIKKDEKALPENTVGNLQEFQNRLNAAETYRERLEIYREILEEINKHTGIVYIDNSYNVDEKNIDLVEDISLLYKLNKYNKQNPITYLQNRIMYKMYKLTSGMANLEAAIKPMDSALVNDKMDNILILEKAKPVIYKGFNPITKFLIQEENAVGKTNVGIAANGIKALSGLQQYANIKLQNREEFYRPYIELKFPTLGNREFTLTDISNIIQTLDQFKDKLKNIYGNDYATINNNPLLKILQERLSPDYKAISDPNKELSDRLLNCYKAFLNINSLSNIENPEQWAEFLYYFSKFDDNSADIMSVFISLATDNAKELRLAMMNATPELMSIPITLVTYGMDLKDVLWICMKVLQPVAKQINQNRFINKKNNVDQAITIAYKNDKLTRESLQKIVALASELRYLTSFYKINQGANTHLTELQRWIFSLGNIKKDKESSKAIIYKDYTIEHLVTKCQNIAKNPNNIIYDELTEVLLSRCNLISIEKLRNNSTEEERQLYMSTLLNAIQEAFNPQGKSIKIDFNRLYSDKEYAQNIINYFNIISIGHNVIDVVLNSLSYKAQLQATQEQIKLFNGIICTSAISQALIELDVKSNSDSFSSLTQAQSDSRVKQLFGHLSVAELVKRLTDFSFGTWEVKQKFKGYTLNIEGDIQSQFNLSSRVGIKNFMNIVTNAIIPNLKLLYKDEYFIKSLSLTYDRRRDITYYYLPFNIFAKDTEQNELNSVGECEVSFQRIMKNTSGLVNKFGKELTIGEVLYIYNLISTAGSMGALRTCVDHISEYKPKLPEQYADVIRDFDTYTEQYGFSEENKLISEDLIHKLYTINTALSTSSKEATVDGKKISLKREWLYTLTPYKTTISTDLAIKEYIKSKNPEYIKDIDIIRDDNGQTSTYKVTLSYKIGFNNNEKTKTEVVEYSASASPTEADLDALIYRIQSKLMDIRDISEINGYYDYDITQLKQLQFSQKILQKIVESIKDTKIKLFIEESSSPTKGARVLLINGEYNLIIPKSFNFSTLDNTQINYLIDALLTIKTGSVSQIAHAIELVKTYYPNINLTEQNFNVKIKEIANLLTNEKEALNYIRYVINENSDPLFIERVKFKLEQFKQIYGKDVQTNKFYFEKSTEDIADLKEGDIFEQDEVLYIYLGTTNLGLHILCPLNTTDVNIKFENIAPHKDESYKRKYIIKRSPNVIFGEVISEQFVYIGNPIENVNFNSIAIGDKLLIGDDQYVIVDSVYNRHNNRELIVKNEKDNSQIDVTEKLYNSIEGIKVLKSTLNRDQSPNNVEHQFIGYVPLEVLQELKFGTVVQDSNKTYYFQKLLNNNEILVANTENNESTIIKIDSIRSIVAPYRVIDKEFRMQGAPLSVYYSESADKESKDISRQIELNYLLNEGILLKDTQKEKSGKSLLKIGTRLSSSYKQQILKDPSRNITLRFLQTYKEVPSVMVNYIPQEGDVILYGDDAFKVVKKIKSVGSATQYLAIHQGLEPDKQSYKIISVDKRQITYDGKVGDGKQCIIYTKNNYKGQFRRDQSIDGLTDSALCRGFLQTLSEYFNLDIQTVEDPTDPNLARVLNGKIIINVAKKGNVSTNTYIIEQGVHEFTHLVLANLQAHHGNLYYDMMQRVKTLLSNPNLKEDIKIIWSNIQNNPTYKTSQEKYQEFIVRYITQMFNTNSGLQDGTETEQTLVKALYNSYDKFLQDISKGGFNRFNSGLSVKNILLNKDSNFYDIATEDFDLEFIRQNYLDNEIIEKIKCF